LDIHYVIENVSNLRYIYYYLLEAKVSNSSIYENYLRPLTKHGIINSVRSVINGKENLYYPVNQENEDNTSILPLTEDCRLIINKPLNEKDVLEESFRTLLGRRSNGSGVKYKIIDIDAIDLSLFDFFGRYFFIERMVLSIIKLW
jgi:hypothetical protein